MSNVNVNSNRNGPEAMRDNDRSYDTDYALANREFRPPRTLPLDWRSVAVIVFGFLASYIVLLLVYSIWKLFYCWSRTCDTINAVEPFAVAILIFVPFIVVGADVLSRLWTRTRFENAVANRTNLVLNRYGDPRPADIFDRVPVDQLIKMLLREYNSAAGMEERIAPFKVLPRGLNSYSPSNSRTTHGADIIDAEPVEVDPLALLPSSDDDPLIKTLISRGLIDRSGNSLFVGLSAGGKPHFIELDETGLIALAGMTQVGKSTTATSFVAQLSLIDDSIVIVCDKHGRKNKGLLNRLAPIAHRFDRAAIEPAEIISAIDYWYEIGANRIGEDNNRQYPPCFIAIDEFTALVLLDLLPAASLLRLMSGAVEFAKVQCHGLIIGHQWTGKLLGTFGATMRRACTQRLIHRIDPQDAGFLINSSAAKQILSLPDGAAIFQGASNPSPLEVRIPQIQHRDLDYIARLLPAAPKLVPATSVSGVAGVASAPECDRNDPPNVATVKPEDFATDHRTIVARSLLAKKIGDQWQYNYREVQALTKLATSTIVSIAATIGRGSGKIKR